MPLALQMRCTWVCEMPACRAIDTKVQCEPSGGGCKASVTTRRTVSGGTTLHRLRPMASFSPAMPRVRNRRSHRRTTGAVMPTSSAACLWVLPSERNRMRRALGTSRGNVVDARTIRSSSRLCCSLTSSFSIGYPMASFLLHVGEVTAGARRIAEWIETAHHDLLRGRIRRFSLDALMIIATALQSYRCRAGSMRS
jgi:hypothetical protein